jgi:hypothetical protein
MQRTKLSSAAFLILTFAAGPALGADLPPSMVTIERFAAERGDADAQYFMGEHHELGDSGLEKSAAKALAWYAKAAEQNHAAAQYKVGVFHENGLAGLAPQIEVAKEWYRRSAERGSRQAQQRLAEFDAARLDAETKRQEQQRRAEWERQEQQRKSAAAEKARARELQVAKAAAATVAPAKAAAPSPPVAKREKPTLAAEPLLEHVLAGKWYEGGRPAEFLPTSDTSCLKTADKEITCFSKERRRVITGTELTFSLKTVLHGFAENQFAVGYTYHVNGMREAASAGTSKDDHGLLVAEGWQQPGRSATCHFKELGRLECQGAQTKARDYVVR